MAKQETLKKVEYDITNGNLGKARDRLHGLINTYPNDLKLREKLGAIYWQLKQPAMAGRYWYLIDAKTPEMKAAQAAFQNAFGNNPLLMLQAIKFRGAMKAIAGTPAEAKLQALLERAKKTYRDETLYGLPGMPPKGTDPPPEQHPWQYRLTCAVLLLIVLLLLALIGIGAGTVVEWLF